MVTGVALHKFVQKCLALNGCGVSLNGCGQNGYGVALNGCGRKEYGVALNGCGKVNVLV